jgi:AcrR family transcriptional regulator
MQPDMPPGGRGSRHAKPVPEEVTDGRLARGQRTRLRVVEALVELLHEGDPDPTARAIAERAGISLRLVFHHFNDIDDLYRAVGAHQLECHWVDLPTLAPTLALSTRIDRLVRHRSALYEEISPVRRSAVRRASISPGIRQLLNETDGLLRDNLSNCFAPELAARPEADGIELLHVLDSATAWENWDRMRHRYELPVGTARRVMTRTVRAVFIDQ